VTVPLGEKIYGKIRKTNHMGEKNKNHPRKKIISLQRIKGVGFLTLQLYNQITVTVDDAEVRKAVLHF
jgi:hypothetical protein